MESGTGAVWAEILRVLIDQRAGNGPINPLTAVLGEAGSLRAAASRRWEMN